MANQYIIQSGKIPPLGGTLMSDSKMSNEQCKVACDKESNCSAFYRSSDTATSSKFYTPPVAAVFRKETNAQGE